MRGFRHGRDAAVLTEERDGVLVITINRPEARNAINGDVARGIAAALDRLDGEDGLRVGVLTGGGGFFSSGMDLKGFLSGDVPIIEGRGLGGLTERPPRKPLIAAIEGYAVAGGFELVLACDLVVAAEDARLGVPEVKRALVAGAGAAIHLPQRIPQAIAMEMLLTGEPITAARAAELGLVNRVVPPGYGARRCRRAGPRGRGQRPAGRRGHQADRPLGPGLDLRRGLAEAGRADGSGLRLRGRPGGRPRLRREARAGLEGSLALSDPGAYGGGEGRRPLQVGGVAGAGEELQAGSGDGLPRTGEPPSASTGHPAHPTAAGSARSMVGSTSERSAAAIRATFRSIVAGLTSAAMSSRSALAFGDGSSAKTVRARSPSVGHPPRLDLGGRQAAPPSGVRVGEHQ